jgi:NADPH2:quinone reductase
VVKVQATSVNPIDAKLRQRELPFSRGLPTVLHGDFAGVVVEVGARVSKFSVGDEVYGCCGSVAGTDGGALAEFMLVDEQLTSLKPKNLSFVEAAALPLVAITAWEALFDKLHIRSGSTVLIHAGLGGVGHIAAQLARFAGAIVHTTVGSDEAIPESKRFGAHTASNYKTTQAADYTKQQTGGRGFDYVFDTVGGPNLQNSFAAARYNGSIACIATGGQHDLTTMYLKGQSLHSVLMLIPLITGEGRAHYGDILFQVKKLVEDGYVKPLLHKEVFSLDKISQAHALLESGKQQGKIAVQIA